MIAGRPEGTDCIVDEATQIFVHGVPEARSVIVYELLPQIHKLSVVEEWHIDELLERLHAATDKFTRHDCARIMYVLCDYRNVPKRKGKTQAKRRVAYKKGGGESYETHTQITRQGILDTKTGVTNPMVDPSRLAHSSHMRHQLVEVLLQYFREFAYPSHVFIFFDACERHGVRLLHGSTCTTLPEMTDAAAEGEVRAVRRVLEVLKAFPDVISCEGLDDVPTRIAVCTVDTDVIPLLVEHLWDTECHDLALVNVAGEYIAIDRLIAFLKQNGWTWQAFKGGCICSGTDYTEKAKYTHGIGGHIAWQAWHASAGAMSDSHRVNRDVLFEELLCAAYGAKIRGEVTTFAPSARQIRQMVGTKRKRLERFPLGEDKELYRSGKEDFDWLWEYWGSLGAITGERDSQVPGSSDVAAAAIQAFRAREQKRDAAEIQSLRAREQKRDDDAADDDAKRYPAPASAAAMRPQTQPRAAASAHGMRAFSAAVDAASKETAFATLSLPTTPWQKRKPHDKDEKHPPPPAFYMNEMGVFDDDDDYGNGDPSKDVELLEENDDLLPPPSTATREPFDEEFGPVVAESDEQPRKKQKQTHERTNLQAYLDELD